MMATAREEDLPVEEGAGLQSDLVPGLPPTSYRPRIYEWESYLQVWKLPQSPPPPPPSVEEVRAGIQDMKVNEGFNHSSGDSSGRDPTTRDPPTEEEGEEEEDNNDDDEDDDPTSETYLTRLERKALDSLIWLESGGLIPCSNFTNGWPRFPYGRRIGNFPVPSESEEEEEGETPGEKKKECGELEELANSGEGAAAAAAAATVSAINNQFATSSEDNEEEEEDESFELSSDDVTDDEKQLQICHLCC